MTKPIRLVRLLSASLAFAGLAGILPLSPAAKAESAPRVAVSIKPIHSLVAAVMEGVGSPLLIVQGGGSPHTYALRPSEARMLAGADVVFYVGDDFETFLSKPLRILAGERRVVALADLPGMHLLEGEAAAALEAAALEADVHEIGGEHADHEAPEGGDAAEEAGHHDHHEGANLHLWLDPGNARKIVLAVAEELGRQDKDNAARYRANAERYLGRLDVLDQELEATLAGVRHVPYLTFHDAYGYFEKRYGLSPAGVIAVSPERAPGARKLVMIHEIASNTGAVCLFAEPQFRSAIVESLAADLGLRHGVLDPLGSAMEPGPQLYEKLMKSLARELRACLEG